MKNFSNRLTRVVLSTVFLLFSQINLVLAAADSDEAGLSFGFWEAIQIIGALAFFIFGMKMMSEGIQSTESSRFSDEKHSEVYD